MFLHDDMALDGHRDVVEQFLSVDGIWTRIWRGEIECAAWLAVILNEPELGTLGFDRSVEEGD